MTFETCVQPHCNGANRKAKDIWILVLVSLPMYPNELKIEISDNKKERDERVQISEWTVLMAHRMENNMALLKMGKIEAQTSYRVITRTNCLDTERLISFLSS